MIAEAFREGSRGAALDVVLLGRPWGFRLEEISPRVYLWQGEADVLVPVSMGRHLAAAIPNCQATFFPGEGHLLFADHMADIVQVFATSPDGETRSSSRGTTSTTVAPVGGGTARSPRPIWASSWAPCRAGARLALD